jgi:hypothetical protein
LTRIRALFAICALALSVPAVLAGCGSDDSSSDVGGSAEGDQGGSFEASIEGPFQGDPDNPGSIPQLDWTGSISGQAAGQSISFDGSLVVTDDNAYVEYGGNAYEVGSETFNQFKQLAESAASQQSSTEGLSFTDAFTQGCEAQLKAAGGDASACDIDFEGWLADLTNDGTEEIEGTDTNHISGSLDVAAMLDGAAPTDAQVQQIADAISEASFDLYSGTDDQILRGLDFKLSLDPSQIPEASAAGITGVDVNFSLRLGGVNEDQTIEAPSDAQPIGDLLSQFGIDPSSLGGLGGLSGLGGGALGGPGGLPGSGGGGGGAADAYLDCISKATTPKEINECASQL